MRVHFPSQRPDDPCAEWYASAHAIGLQPLVAPFRDVRARFLERRGTLLLPLGRPDMEGTRELLSVQLADPCRQRTEALSAALRCRSILGPATAVPRRSAATFLAGWPKREARARVKRYAALGAARCNPFSRVRRYAALGAARCNPFSRVRRYAALGAARCNPFFTPSHTIDGRRHTQNLADLLPFHCSPLQPTTTQREQQTTERQTKEERIHGKRHYRILH